MLGLSPPSSWIYSQAEVEHISRLGSTVAVKESVTALLCATAEYTILEATEGPSSGCINSPTTDTKPVGLRLGV